MTYDLQVGDGTRQTPHQLALAFQGNSQVAVAVDGAGLGTFRMDPDGRVATDSHPYLELFAAIPPASKLKQQGAEHVALFPDADARSLNPNAAILGATLTSKVEQTGARPRIALTGHMGLIDNAGGRTLIRAWLGDDPLPGVEPIAAAIAEKGTTYLTGEAVFDEAAGQLVSLRATWVEFPTRPLSAAEVKTADRRVELSMALVP